VLRPGGRHRHRHSRQSSRTTTIALFPELRRLLVAWKVKSPFTDADDYVPVTASRGPVQQRNAQRTLEKAKEAAGLGALEGRLSWHSLRHSAGSIWLTEYGDPCHDRERDEWVTQTRLSRWPATGAILETSRRWWRTCSHEPPRLPHKDTPPEAATR